MESDRLLMSIHPQDHLIHPPSFLTSSNRVQQAMHHQVLLGERMLEKLFPGLKVSLACTMTP